MRSQTTHWLAIILAAVISGTGAKAASFDPAQSLVEAATTEGEIVWYTSFVQNQLARPMAEAFSARFPGVKVRVVSGTVSDLLVRLLGEGRAGALQGDVSHAGNAVGPLRRAGLVEEYRPVSAAAYPAEYRDPEGFWTAEAVYVLGPVVNTTLVPPTDRPRTYQDLLDPRWRNKLAWTNQMAQSGPPAFIAMIEAKLGPRASQEYFAKLAPNIVNVPANQRVVLDQVIAGEYPIGMMMFNHHVATSEKTGAPLEWLPLDPIIQTMDTIFLLKGPHPNAGKLFIEFVLSDEGQAVFEKAGYTPAHPHRNPLLKAGDKPPTIVLSPGVVDAGLPGWISTFDKYFH